VEYVVALQNVWCLTFQGSVVVSSLEGSKSNENLPKLNVSTYLRKKKGSSKKIYSVESETYRAGRHDESSCHLRG
jgi:hypothetical protein